MKIYIDLDGVLADFVSGFNKKYPVKLSTLSYSELTEYKKKFAKDGFFGGLPEFTGAKKFIKSIQDMGHTVEILTAVSEYDSEENAKQKAKWVRTKFGNIKFNYVKKSNEKAKYANSNTLLIDDREKSIVPFRRANGKVILHTSFADTLNKLKNIKEGVTMRTYKDVINESKTSYVINHPTLSSAVAEVGKYLDKNGYDFDEDDFFRKVSSGPKKPSKGKTNKYLVDIMKNGKPVKNKSIAFQVYGKDNGQYELNLYLT